MEQLRETLDDCAQMVRRGNTEVACPQLQEAAVRWAMASLANFNGTLLKKALAVSAALSEFTAECEKLGMPRSH